MKLVGIILAIIALALAEDQPKFAAPPSIGK